MTVGMKKQSHGTKDSDGKKKRQREKINSSCHSV